MEAATGGRADIWAEVSAFFACFMVPVAMFFANRSSVLFLGIAAAIAVTGLARNGRLPAFAGALEQAVRRPAGFALAAFVAFLGLSLFWTAFPKTALTAYGELIAGLGGAVVLAAAWSVEPPARAGRMLVAGILLAALLAIIDLRSGMALRHGLGIRPDSFVLNRSLVTLLVLVWPALLLTDARNHVFALLAGLVVALAILLSESGAATVGAIVACLAALLARFAPRAVTALLAGGVLVVLLLSPWIGPLMDLVLPAPAHEAMANMHSRDRVDIWRSFGAAVEHRFWLGSGFNASARMADDPVAALVSEANRVLLGAGHPHNALLQVWVEGGLVAALLLSAAIIATAGCVWRMPAGRAAYVLPLAGGAMTIASVSHGAWQGWWIAVLGLAVALVALKGRGVEHG